MYIIYKFSSEVLSKLKIQCIYTVYFSFNFGWYTIQLDIVRSEQGVKAFYLKFVKCDKSYLLMVPMS